MEGRVAAKGMVGRVGSSGVGVGRLEWPLVLTVPICCTIRFMQHMEGSLLAMSVHGTCVDKHFATSLGLLALKLFGRVTDGRYLGRAGAFSWSPCTSLKAQARYETFCLG